MLEEADEDAPQETAPPRKPTTVLVERCTLSTSAFPARRVENLTEFAGTGEKETAREDTANSGMKKKGENQTQTKMVCHFRVAKRTMWTRAVAWK